MAQRGKESFSLFSLSREAGNVRRVIHPGQQPDRLGLGIAEAPDSRVAPSTARLDRARDSRLAANVSLNPFEKRTAGRDQRHIKPFIDVIRPLCGVISVRVYAVYTATHPSPSMHPRKKSTNTSSGIASGPSVRLLAGVSPMRRSQLYRPRSHH